MGTVSEYILYTETIFLEFRLCLARSTLLQLLGPPAARFIGSIGFSYAVLQNTTLVNTLSSTSSLGAKWTLSSSSHLLCFLYWERSLLSQDPTSKRKGRKQVQEEMERHLGAIQRKMYQLTTQGRIVGS